MAQETPANVVLGNGRNVYKPCHLTADPDSALTVEGLVKTIKPEMDKIFKLARRTAASTPSSRMRTLW